MDEDGLSPSLLPLWLFLAACAVELSAALVRRRCQGSPSSAEEAELRRSIHQLRKRADQLNTPATFAKSAKLLREVAAKEKALAELQRQQGGGPAQKITWRSGVSLGRLAFRGVAYLLYRNTAVVRLPLATVQPLGGVLAWPHGASWQGGGSVAVLPWMSMCLLVGGYVAERLVPQRQKEHKL